MTTTRLDPIDLTRLLIGFDTTSRGTNLPLIDFAQELLEAAGAKCRRTYDSARQKANLFATLGPDYELRVVNVLGLHADSASPMPRPSAEMPAILVTRAKCSKFIVIPLIVPMDQA